MPVEVCWSRPPDELLTTCWCWWLLAFDEDEEVMPFVCSFAFRAVDAITLFWLLRGCWAWCWAVVVLLSDNNELVLLLLFVLLAVLLMLLLLLVVVVVVVVGLFVIVLVIVVVLLLLLFIAGWLLLFILSLVLLPPIIWPKMRVSV